jgi:hypothetical protein
MKTRRVESTECNGSVDESCDHDIGLVSTIMVSRDGAGPGDASQFPEYFKIYTRMCT